MTVKSASPTVPWTEKKKRETTLTEGGGGGGNMKHGNARKEKQRNRPPLNT